MNYLYLMRKQLSLNFFTSPTKRLMPKLLQNVVPIGHAKIMKEFMQINVVSQFYFNLYVGFHVQSKNQIN